MDDQQLHREYANFCMYHSNPPSYASWLESRGAREAPKSMSEYRRFNAQGIVVPKPGDTSKKP